MASAKALVLKRISARDATRVIKALHYSGKVTSNSQLHFGVFLDGKCGGAMTFGPPMDKNRAMNIVPDTPWDGMLELNRMAFADWLPRNGESRMLRVALRWIKKRLPSVQWVQTFADATQCGDGTIYRAAGFDLIGIKKNTSILRMPDGSIITDKTLNDRVHAGGRRGASIAKESGAVSLPGFQIKYIVFLDPSARERLTVDVLPYSAIADARAGMYRGEQRAGSSTVERRPLQAEGGGSSPTPALHDDGGEA